MATTEVQLSEHQPMLTPTNEGNQSSSVASSAVPVETSATVVRKNVDEGIKSDDRNNFVQTIRALLVELIGTTLFILIGMWGACSDGGIIVTALSFGLTLMVFAASFTHISGVHFNPAVTVGIVIAGAIEPTMALLYVVMQLLGGVAAAGVLRLLLVTRTYAQCKGGATLLAHPTLNKTSVMAVVYTVDQVRVWQGILIESIATFIFVTVILMVLIDTRSRTGIAPIIVGFTLVANILAVGTYTGGSLNPARSLGPAIFASQWKDHFVYWIGPLVGAIVAALLYRTVWAHHDRRMFVRRTPATATKA